MTESINHSADAGKPMYCAKCAGVTPHEYIEDDPYFKVGLMCRQCMIVWAAEDDLTYDDFIGDCRRM